MSKKYRPVSLVTLVVIIIIGIFMGLVWGNNVIIHQHPMEKEFLVPWMGMRTFLELEKDPYSEFAAQRAQVLYYGRLANSNEDPLFLDQPFASEILYFPFALIEDYAIARIIWMILLESALFGSAFIALLLFEWKLPSWLMTIYVLSAILGVQAFFPLLKNDKVILIVFCILLSLLSLRKGRDELAGAFLALSLFQPFATAIFWLVVIWWVIKNNRRRVLWGMLIILGFLYIISFALLPGWLLPFIRSFKTEYPFYSNVTTFEVFSNFLPAIGNKIAAVLTVGVFGIMILELRSKYTDEFRWFIWAVMVSLALSSLLGAPGYYGNNIFLFAPVTLILKILSEKLILPKRWLSTGLLLGILFAIGWGVAIKLVNLNNRYSSDLVGLIIPSLFTIIGLYWIRWWAVHPYHSWTDMIHADQKDDA